ncbi:MAG: Npt1/Npt2 family nucleotide transporter [Planctomycetota bacterium]
MNWIQSLARWFDVRPSELRNLGWSCFGAFLILAQLVLGRSLREALYLARFDVATLPYVTVATVVLSVPAVFFFSRMLERLGSQVVLRGALLIQAFLLSLHWPFLETSQGAVVSFYLVSSAGTLVLTSAFWVVAGELFPLRSAKRLFGLIGAGGTAGAMVMGTSLSWLTTLLDPGALVLLLSGILVATAGVSVFLRVPTTDPGTSVSRADEPDRVEREPVWRNAHVRGVSLIVVIATVVTTLIDFQFKEALTHQFTEKEDLAAFLGAFYGWTGGISLLVQLLVGGRLLKLLGIGRTLSILPILVFGGSVVFLIAPSLVGITLVRGANASLRKSLYRSVIEVLFLPIPDNVRRRAKTFVDSILDSAAEAIGAGVVFLWVTWGGFSSVYLSVFVLVLSAAFLIQNARMNRQYVRALFRRVVDGISGGSESQLDAQGAGRERVSESLDSVAVPDDLLRLPTPSEEPRSPQEPAHVTPVPKMAERLLSLDESVVRELLANERRWHVQYTPALVALLGREGLYAETTRVLLSIGPDIEPHLIASLQDEAASVIVRRRIPRIVAKIPTARSEAALLDALLDDRFEVRYRSGLGLHCRRRNEIEPQVTDWKDRVWQAIRLELDREHAVWELQEIADRFGDEGDAFELFSLDGRGRISLAHTFRLLSLVLDTEAILSAFHGVLLGTPQLRQFALEYLELVLPGDVRQGLWRFVGDLSGTA